MSACGCRSGFCARGNWAWCSERRASLNGGPAQDVAATAHRHNIQRLVVVPVVVIVSRLRAINAAQRLGLWHCAQPYLFGHVAGRNLRQFSQNVTARKTESNAAPGWPFSYNATLSAMLDWAWLVDPSAWATHSSHRLLFANKHLRAYGLQVHEPRLRNLALFAGCGVNAEPLGNGLRPALAQPCHLRCAAEGLNDVF